MSTSHLIRQERCPQCAKLGRDISHDNLAVYSDSHTHCYSCGYHTYSDKVSQFNARKRTENINIPQKNIVILPSDCNVEYPKRCIEWIEKYELNRYDLLNNNVLWSEYKQRLIFPVYDSEKGVIAFQGRYFGEKKEPKWFGKGDLKNTFNILGNSNKLCLVEDIVSALKISKVGMAMPLYGSYIGKERFKRLYRLYGKEVEVLIWLDPDKRLESIKEAKLGTLYGLNTRVIYTEEDPKEVKLSRIKELLDKEV